MVDKYCDGLINKWGVTKTTQIAFLGVMGASIFCFAGSLLLPDAQNKEKEND